MPSTPFCLNRDVGILPTTHNPELFRLFQILQNHCKQLLAVPNVLFKLCYFTRWMVIQHYPTEVCQPNLNDIFQDESGGLPAGSSSHQMGVRGSNVLNRVGHQQDKWKKQVREQRKNIYDRHTMLNQTKLKACSICIIHRNSFTLLKYSVIKVSDAWRMNLG